MTMLADSKRKVKCFTNNIIDIPTNLRVLNDDEITPANHCCWRILSKDDGDKRVVWDATSIPQIAEAKRLFDKLRSEGMVAYRVGIDGKQSSDEMKEFDPFAEEVIFLKMAHVVGG